VKPGEHAGLPVARYLRPEETVVPFRRRPELEDLLRWCTSAGHAAVQLVTGDGGAGKTRLALRLGEELATNGWQPLWVPRGSERDAARAVHTMGQPCVLVVDYAETRSDLAGLLDDVAADQDGPDLRVVLLARSAGEWWQHLLAGAEEPTAALLEAHTPVTLGPVRAAGGPQELFDDAVVAFAQKLGVSRPDGRLVLSDPDPVVLVVHAAALLAVADYAAGEPPVQAVSGLEVLEALLRHEARYWARSAAARDLDLDVSVLRLAVAVGCLIGAESETAAGALLSRVPDLDSAERCGRVARWLHDLYPVVPENEIAQREWLGPLRPDRLAEQLVAGELARRRDLIAPLFTGLSEARATRALTVLARAALTQDRAVSLLRTALAADLERLAVPALLVAVETNPVVGELLSEFITGQPVSRETLARIAAESPYPSLALAAPAALALQQLADDSTDDSERAGRLSDLSNRLADLGRREEALAAVEQAVTIRRQLAGARPDAFLPNLAASLNNQSNHLAGLGRREEALAAVEQATGIYRQLAEDRPDAFLPNLAASLNNQSLCLGELGRREEALAAVEQAITIRRQLAGARPDAFLPDLATSLNNQSNQLAGLGRREEALAAVEQAITIRRQLAGGRPDAFLPNLATSLYSLADTLSSLNRNAGASAIREEADAARSGNWHSRKA
jgi:tetratricopeptide (TPR) repeat protein